MTGGVGGLMKKNEIEVVEGHGALTGGGGVSVDGSASSRPKTIVLATGSVPLPIPGTSFDGRVVDTAGAWLLNEQPKSMAVVGAGASGAEIASAFGRFGTEVILLEMLDQVLPVEDAEIAKVVAARAQEAERQGRDRDAGRGGEAVGQRASSSRTAASRRPSTTSASPPAARPTPRVWGSTQRASRPATAA